MQKVLESSCDEFWGQRSSRLLPTLGPEEPQQTKVIHWSCHWLHPCKASLTHWIIRWTGSPYKRKSPQNSLGMCWETALWLFTGIWDDFPRLHLPSVFRRASNSIKTLMVWIWAMSRISMGEIWTFNLWYRFHIKSKISSSWLWHHWWKLSRIWNWKFLCVQMVMGLSIKHCPAGPNHKGKTVSSSQKPTLVYFTIIYGKVKYYFYACWLSSYEVIVHINGNYVKSNYWKSGRVQ